MNGFEEHDEIMSQLSETVNLGKHNAIIKLKTPLSTTTGTRKIVYIVAVDGCLGLASAPSKNKATYQVAYTGVGTDDFLDYVNRLSMFDILNTSDADPTDLDIFRNSNGSRQAARRIKQDLHQNRGSYTFENNDMCINLYTKSWVLITDKKNGEKTMTVENNDTTKFFFAQNREECSDFSMDKSNGAVTLTQEEEDMLLAPNHDDTEQVSDDGFSSGIFVEEEPNSLVSSEEEGECTRQSIHAKIDKLYAPESDTLLPRTEHDDIRLPDTGEVDTNQNSEWDFDDNSKNVITLRTQSTKDEYIENINLDGKNLLIETNMRYIHVNMEELEKKDIMPTIFISAYNLVSDTKKVKLEEYLDKLTQILKILSPEISLFSLLKS